jgi:photosystem II stability/assembly factor-like uncharacterized protein
METEFFVATRKGLFVMHLGQDNCCEIKALHFPGEPVSQILFNRFNHNWYAALRLGHFGPKLNRSGDQGKSWHEITTPAFPPKPTEGPWAEDPTPWSVEMVWAIESGANAKFPEFNDRLWAACMPAGIFRSDDAGQTWQLCQSFWLDERRRAWMGGGNDYPGAHTILIDPLNPHHVTVAISCGGTWSTQNSGATWENIGKGFNATFMPPELASDPNAQDPHRIAHCQAHPDVMWIQMHGGIYRSVDAGQQWQLLPPHADGDFGFPIVADPVNPLRAWVVPAQADSHRYAPKAAMSVMRTDDGGQTWQAFRSGLPQTHAYDLVYRHGLDVAADGITMVMASTTGNIWTSLDAGETWRLQSEHLPPVAVVRFG